MKTVRGVANAQPQPQSTESAGQPAVNAADGGEVAASDSGTAMDVIELRGVVSGVHPLRGIGLVRRPWRELVTISVAGNDLVVEAMPGSYEVGSVVYVCLAPAGPEGDERETN